MTKTVFELSKQENSRHECCVIVNDYENLELLVLFEGDKSDCEFLLDRLTEAQSRGMLK